MHRNVSKVLCIQVFSMTKTCDSLQVCRYRIRLKILILLGDVPAQLGSSWGLCWELLHWLAWDAEAKPLLGRQAVPGWAEVFSQAWAWLPISAQGLLALLPGLVLEPLQ